MIRFLCPSRRYMRFFSSSCLIKESLRGCQQLGDFIHLQTFKNSSLIAFSRLLSTHFKNMACAPTLLDVVRQLEEFAPLSLAESWDNVGLLLEPTESKPIKTVFLTNDLTEPVLEEALTESADLIISYHPPLFKALKKITQKTWKERIVSKCLKEGIAVYSPHTCWDTTFGGVNEWLLSGLPEGKSSPIIPNKTHSSSDFQLKLDFQNVSIEQCAAIKKFSSSYSGSVRLITDLNGHLISVLISEKLISTFKSETGVSSFASSTAPTELGSDGGTGRIHQLNTPVSIQELVNNVKKHCGFPMLQVGLATHHTLDSKVSKIAICAGSGSSVLIGVPADVYLTGEMSHHDVLEANHNNVTVILTHHSNSERGFLKVFADKLSKSLKSKGLIIKTIVSKKDCDPLAIL